MQIGLDKAKARSVATEQTEKKKGTRYIGLANKNKQNQPSRILSLQHSQKSKQTTTKTKEVALNNKRHSSPGC